MDTTAAKERMRICGRTLKTICNVIQWNTFCLFLLHQTIKSQKLGVSCVCSLCTSVCISGFLCLIKKRTEKSNELSSIITKCSSDDQRVWQFLDLDSNPFLTKTQLHLGYTSARRTRRTSCADRRSRSACSPQKYCRVFGATSVSLSQLQWL